MEKLSMNELLELKHEREAELEKINDLIELKKKLEKPFGYQISSYSRSIKGKCKNLRDLKVKLHHYLNTERVGTGLINTGSSFTVDSHGNELLHSFFCSKNSSVVPLKFFASLLMDVKQPKGGFTTEEFMKILVSDLKDKYPNSIFSTIPDSMSESIVELGRKIDLDYELAYSELESRNGFIHGDYLIKKKEGRILVEPID